MTDTTTETTPVRGIHEFALEARIRLLMRAGKTRGPEHLWELATGAAAAWYVHRLLARLAEVDPEGVHAFAAELVEEGEMPEYADDPGDVARAMGFNVQAWVDAEYARQDATNTTTKEN